MTTNQKIWGKTILSSYNYLQHLCNSIDKLVKMVAVNSYYSYTFKNTQNSISNISDKIINLTNRKIDYINLKILIEKALKDIPTLYAKLLILKYIHKLPILKACEILNISKRSSYKKLEQALSSFMAKLATFGYNTEKIEVEFFGDPFINSIFKLIERNNFVLDEKADVISNDSVFKKYISELMTATI
ncbi:MAG: hypothetical protein E7376_02925 [Clostridiales bacterium]|nr:hypothetical protein [Clostridiales bacterium]